MKIRIKDNSIRLRLTQSEVAELSKNGMVSGVTQFVDRPFIYAIENTNTDELSAVFIENRIVVKMPKTMIEEWLSTDKVGFEGQTGMVKILVEKDFVCIDNTIEDQSDNYPNPSINC
ncbi:MULTISPECIES: DUF7009 family protein [Chryseobacterium]|uniref:DUF7009 family protein n=1 Tax=Chryseobacterium TaxID=59732 RepID=UPI0019564043|nr:MULTISPECIES: hypothetical protein [Chryseobacterium]MBM7420266.1 hypothetical protein [Chryseobacterium sp. JUb44]MDH6210210.1 hypothetical protein [Chryseobacterium sp. BIGb0186]WSO08927.1 hypothetical protein VUJ64_13950 [Chryseobacterium scophthalmum]